MVIFCQNILQKNQIKICYFFFEFFSKNNKITKKKVKKILGVKNLIRK